MTEQITYKENKTEFITRGDISKVIMKLSIPLMISNLIKTFYGIVDGIYVAQLSAEDYAATAFIWPLQYLFIAFGLGISIAATSLMSQKLGAGEKQIEVLVDTEVCKENVSRFLTNAGYKVTVKEVADEATITASK